MNLLVGLHRSCVVILFFSSFRESYAISSYPIVVVFGFDGFRHDYLSRGLNPVLQKLSEDGVSVDYLANIFPTTTLANFFAIATGMYAETHGVLGTKVFNENGQCLHYGDELYHYNDHVIPIWTLNEMNGQGRHSGCMMWPGCDFSYQNHTSTYSQKYEPTIKWTDRIDMIMSWLLDAKKPVNLINAYFEQPDFCSHRYGPYSKQVDEKLKKVDDILQYFLSQIDKYNLRDRVNLIVLSDHGMTEIKTDQIIKINHIIDRKRYKKCGHSPMIELLPKPGYEKQIYENLTAASTANRTFTVYKPHEIPDRWHWKNNKRNIGLLALTNPSLVFHDMPNRKGIHGYPPEVKDMRAFFAAKGPVFRTNFHTSSLRNIDVYPLIAYILHLPSSPKQVKPNGTLTNIVHILKTSRKQNSYYNYYC